MMRRTNCSAQINNNVGIVHTELLSTWLRFSGSASSLEGESTSSSTMVEALLKEAKADLMKDKSRT